MFGTPPVVPRMPAATHAGITPTLGVAGAPLTTSSRVSEPRIGNGWAEAVEAAVAPSSTANTPASPFLITILRFNPWADVEAARTHRARGALRQVRDQDAAAK